MACTNVVIVVKFHSEAEEIQFQNKSTLQNNQVEFEIKNTYLSFFKKEEKKSFERVYWVANLY